MQHIYRFNAPKYKMDPFGLSEPQMTEKAMARMVIFAKTVKKIEPQLIGFDFEITVGIKVLEIKPKKKEFNKYGTYVVLSRDFISRNTAGDIYKMMIDKFQEVHKELDKDLKKYILAENGIPKPLEKID